MPALVAAKLEPLRKTKRPAIGRLDLRFELEQPQLPERDVDDLYETLAHPPGPRIWNEGVVRESTRRLGAPFDLADVCR